MKRIFLILLGLVVLVALVVVVTYNLINKTNGKLESSGKQRKYLLYVPESYDPGKPTPLVISLHGFVEWPAHQMQISGWNELADEQGFIVVYPSGTGFPLRWNAFEMPVLQNTPLIDVIFIADLIDELAHQYNIDLSRVYANGLSNGGGMSYLLACKLSDRIAAIGGVAGAYVYPFDECTPSRPVPVIAFHGTADPIVPYEGGESSHFGLPFPSIPEWIAGWAKRNGCRDKPIEIPASGGVSGIEYTQCDQNIQVILYTVHGGGHTWPGGEGMPRIITGPTNQDIDATRVMWEFFQQYALER